MNVDDMTDEEFIDYCRNGGELSGLITERHPKCDCTGRSIWLRLGLRLVSMPPPISVRWLNTIAVGGRSIPRNTPSMRRSGNVNDN